MAHDSSPLDQLVGVRDFEAVDSWLAEHGAVDIAEELVRLALVDRAVVFRLLPDSRVLAVFEALDPLHQQQLLDALADDSVHELFLRLDADDRARLLEEMPATVTDRMLVTLPDQARLDTNLLLGYPRASAGRAMNPRYADVRVDQTAADALSRVRSAGLRSREVHVVPVTDHRRRFVGVVDLPDLVTAAIGTPVGELIRFDTYSVRVDEDREVAARLMQEADLVALPVVDAEDRLAGLITVDDAMEILESEDTEDIHRVGGVAPLDVAYMDAACYSTPVSGACGCWSSSSLPLPRSPSWKPSRTSWQRSTCWRSSSRCSSTPVATLALKPPRWSFARWRSARSGSPTCRGSCTAS